MSAVVGVYVDHAAARVHLALAGADRAGCGRPVVHRTYLAPAAVHAADPDRICRACRAAFGGVPA